MLEQRSDAWFLERAGKVTASCVYKVMARLKNGQPGADRSNYLAQLVTERLTGRAAESFTNAAMQRGTDLEPLAREAYSEHALAIVDETGFVPHPRIADCGASPDGLIGEDGLVELKCCGASRHIEMLRGDAPEDRYVKQIMFQMACTGREWCDLAYFHPDMPGPMQLVVRHYVRDDALIAEIEGEVRKFLAEVDEAVADLRARYLLKEAA